jgi:NAD(P)-dependent dehydrogenase (short-subunit alcohol dehydrogenase family)
MLRGEMMNDLFTISGKVIVVTGATGVLAGGAAQYLQQNGAKVVYLGRNPERVSLSLEKARKISGDCMGLTCDVLDENALQAGYLKVIEEFGRIDALINGAGGNMPGANIGPDQDIFSLDISDYSKVMDLNITGTVLPTLVFGKAFQEQGHGCVINFSSMSSKQALTRVLGYSNAKAAIDNFTRWMATEMAMKYGDKVRVNAVAPGFFISKQNKALLTNEDGSFTSRGQQVINKTPFRRFGKQEEIYGSIHYLLSDASSFVTGTVLAVDGGFSCFSGV